MNFRNLLESIKMQLDTEGSVVDFTHVEDRISAKELRSLGWSIPTEIPDVATIARASLNITCDGVVADPTDKHKAIATMRLNCMSSFEWVEMDAVISRDIPVGIADDVITILVNGNSVNVTGRREIDHATICEMAECDPDSNPSITLTQKLPHGGRQDVIVMHGESYPLHQGAIINCYVTGNS